VDRVAQHNESASAHPSSLSLDEDARQIIHLELERILSSRIFHGSGRSKQFLSYVVRNSLDGQFENLKERTIGTEVFQRHPDYATSDDSVVRVTAGEVRRRLEQYYHAAPSETLVRIEIPIGSYAPEFRWISKTSPTEDHPHSPDLQATDESAPTVPEEQKVVQPGKSGRRLWLAAASCLGLALVILLIAFGIRHHKQSESAATLFWAPVFNSPRPVLICLFKPVVYRPLLTCMSGILKAIQVNS